MWPRRERRSLVVIEIIDSLTTLGVRTMPMKPPLSWRSVARSIDRNAGNTYRATSSSSATGNEPSAARTAHAPGCCCTNPAVIRRARRIDRDDGYEKRGAVMNQLRFDTLTRSLTGLPSRRDVVRGLAGAGFGVGTLWLPGDTAARKKHKKKKKAKGSPASPPAATCTPNCNDRTCGNNGCGGSCGSCGANHVCQGGTCVCAESPAASCTDRACGAVVTNLCGELVTCSCPGGQQCLSNGSCAIACDETTTCPGTCFCSGRVSTEGARHCIRGILLPQMPCTSTADCPRDSHCQNTLAPRTCVLNSALRRRSPVKTAAVSVR